MFNYGGLTPSTEPFDNRFIKFFFFIISKLYFKTYEQIHNYLFQINFGVHDVESDKSLVLLHEFIPENTEKQM